MEKLSLSEKIALSDYSLEKTKSFIEMIEPVRQKLLLLKKIKE